MKEVATSAKRELNDPVEIFLLLHPSYFWPWRKRGAAFWFGIHQQSQLVEGESIIDIIKPVNVVKIEEESPCGRDEGVAELVDEHPVPVRPVGVCPISGIIV